jgi:hypothetical protein
MIKRVGVLWEMLNVMMNENLMRSFYCLCKCLVVFYTVTPLRLQIGPWANLFAVCAHG